MTECSRCGDCCDPVTLSTIMYQALYDENPDIIVKMDEKNQYTREFAQKYWHLVARTDKTMLIKCDFFDKTNRLCTAYEKRPAICSDYPWYGKDPVPGDRNFPSRCSFRADVGQTVYLTRKDDILP